MGNHRLEALRESVVAGLVDRSPRDSDGLARNVRRVLDRYSGGHLVGRHVLERDLWNALLYERHWQEVELHWHVPPPFSTGSNGADPFPEGGPSLAHRSDRACQAILADGQRPRSAARPAGPPLARKRSSAPGCPASPIRGQCARTALPTDPGRRRPAPRLYPPAIPGQAVPRRRALAH
jgi:hypothetical protein